MSTPEGAVLVGYDGSGDSELALSWGDRLAADRGRPLHVMISEVDPTQILEITGDWHVEKMARLRRDAEDRLKGARSTQTSVEVVEKPPSEALITSSQHASLVVVGARGHSLVSGVVLGSVSQHVARHAFCPVVVTRPPRDPDSTRVVVGVDGSGGSKRALDFAFDHASRSGGPLTVIHGWRNLSRGTGVSAGYPLDSDADEVNMAERIITESLAGFAERYPDVHVTEEAIPVAPHRVLADASQSASLLVVGSRGLGAFAGLLLGSVSQALLHHAECPVAVVR